MTWQDDVIQKVNLDGSFVYIVNDPDGLLFEPKISAALQTQNAILFDDEDPLALRLAYEAWRKLARKNSFVIRLDQKGELFIPYDIQAESKQIDFHLSEFFQDIDLSALRLLPASLFQSVMDAIKLFTPGKLSQQSSLDFLLRHIYRIAPETIQTNTDLVRLLIRKHYVGIEMPTQIEDRLIHLLTLTPKFKCWDFNTLVPNRSIFFDFLQQQWEMYLQSESLNTIANTSWPSEQLIVPFADSDIRVFIDNLFAEGIIKPVKADGLPDGHWAWFGIAKEPEITERERISLLLKNAKACFEQCELESINTEFWFEQSHSLGIMNALFYENKKQPPVAALAEEIKRLNTTADFLFQEWLRLNFIKLQTTPTVRYPAMLHKVPDWLSRRMDSGKKVCLLVLDGMGARQWPLLRNHLQMCANISLDEHACFAWVPTITSISRQALFSGKKPFSFADSLLTTSKEEQLWLDYWQEKGLAKREIKYAKKIESLSNDVWQDLITPPSVKVAGLVINFIDEQMHGIKNGMSALNMVVDGWLTDWHFNERIAELLDKGFEIIITSDHGSQEATGIGYINEGVKADTRGERVRIYHDPALRDSTAQACHGSVITWPGPELGLPKATYPLLANANSAFKSKGDVIVGHGGISLHEVVVPFVIVNRKQ
ncbi:BREX-3 system phosphatase PglZ [Klebsiella pneumoniae]|uniref:BREX-3 system phosphatase PglZ n=1 Tax=Klebsiella pneumoniae TaxID=573 RepID=UPI0024B36733|nr:BREX-3 system phosphatase PglZ [Klebsiella pneumoniae]MDY1807284.1 BREX-3 system phosphatase PglZ [Klebsiella pneumoniae]